MCYDVSTARARSAFCVLKEAAKAEAALGVLPRDRAHPPPPPPPTGAGTRSSSIPEACQFSSACIDQEPRCRVCHAAGGMWQACAVLSSTCVADRTGLLRFAATREAAPRLALRCFEVHRRPVFLSSSRLQIISLLIIDDVHTIPFIPHSHHQLSIELVITQSDVAHNNKKHCLPDTLFPLPHIQHTLINIVVFYLDRSCL